MRLSAIRCYGQTPSKGMRLKNLGGFGLGVAQPPARAPRGAGGGAQGGGRPRPSGFCAVAGREREGLWAYQEGQMGQKMVRFAQLGAARCEISFYTRQGESIEVGGVRGVKTAVFGGHCGGHVVWCS
jgi:hypothetical protein